MITHGDRDIQCPLARKLLNGYSAQNSQLLEVIDSSLFIVSLDDSMPSSDIRESSLKIIFKTPENRLDIKITYNTYSIYYHSVILILYLFKDGIINI